MAAGVRPERLDDTGDHGLVERAQEMALPVVSQPERQTPIHGLHLRVGHHPDGVLRGGQGGPKRPQDRVGDVRMGRQA